MAEQKSRLVLEIDSRDAEQKAEDVRKALGALEDAGIRVKPAMDKAGAGLDGVGKSATKASQNLGQLDKSSDGAGKATVSSSEKYAEASAKPFRKKWLPSRKANKAANYRYQNSFRYPS